LTYLQFENKNYKQEKFKELAKGIQSVYPKTCGICFKTTEENSGKMQLSKKNAIFRCKNGKYNWPLMTLPNLSS